MEIVKGALRSVLGWVLIGIIAGLLHTVVAVQSLEASGGRSKLNSKLICMMAIELMQGEKQKKAIKICSELI